MGHYNSGRAHFILEIISEVWMFPFSKVAHVVFTVCDLQGRVPFLSGRRMCGVRQRRLWPCGTVISGDINHRWRADRRGKSFPANCRVVFYVSISTSLPSVSWRAWIEKTGGKKNKNRGQTRESSDKLAFLN